MSEPTRGTRVSRPARVPSAARVGAPKERCLAGVRVLVSGRNRAGRLALVLGALRGAHERGAEVAYVDRGSEDGSLALVGERYGFVRCHASLEDALGPFGGGAAPRFVACVSLRAEVDWACLRTLLASAAAARPGLLQGALHAPAYVGVDGRAAHDGGDPFGAASRMRGAAGFGDAGGALRPVALPSALPPVWLARRSDALAALRGRWSGTLRTRRDARALLVEPEPEPEGGAPDAPDNSLDAWTGYGGFGERPHGHGGRSR